MRILHINVLDKKATYLNRDGDIVCGNSDYVIEFAFDAEWDAYEEKNARFIWNGYFQDVTFTGTTCPVPIITNATAVEIGVYAGELSTTTPAIIGCQKSILCLSTTPGGVPILKGDKGEDGLCSLFLPKKTIDHESLTPLSGLWHRSDRKSDTFYDCNNMMGELDAGISSRPPRRRWMNLSDPIQGMFCSKDALYYACDGEMMMSLSENRVQVLGVITTEEKVFGALRNELLVLPDHKVYNTSTEKFTDRYIRLHLQNAVIQNNKSIYCTTYDFTSYFVAGDAIRIAGANSNNGYYTIRSVEKNHLHFDDNSFASNSLPATIYVLIDTPIVYGMCTAKNRLWAYGTNTVYASASGNVMRWYRYDGDEQSSYKEKIPSDSIVTGCVEYSGYPVFFTANSMVRVEGDNPANFSLVETSMHGVMPDSAASLCVVGDKMMYLSDAGVVSCDGKTATVVSEALGTHLKNGIATSDGRRYYLSAVDEQGVRALYIYDTVTDVWFKEDGDNIEYLGYLDGDVYAHCSNKVTYIIGEDKTGHGTTLREVSSYVEFHPMKATSEIGEIEQISLEVDVECEADSSVTLSVCYDNGEWEQCEQAQGAGSYHWIVSLDGRVCHSAGVRIDGVGAYKVYSITKKYTETFVLPQVTEEDNGKSVLVENGEWAIGFPQGCNPLPDQGLQGDSAYDIAVKNGFEGSEEEWLTSLKGEKGEQGPQGEKGDKGEDGIGGIVIEVASLDQLPNDANEGSIGIVPLESREYVEVAIYKDGKWVVLADAIARAHIAQLTEEMSNASDNINKNMLTITTRMLSIENDIDNLKNQGGDGGIPEISDVVTPTNSSKYIMRDADGNLAAVNPIDPRYPNLIYSYTHTGNFQVQPTELDLATGIFTAPAHGLDSWVGVVVTMNDSYYVGAPYDYLPVGLSLGTVSNTATATQYFLNMVDEDHVALSETFNGAYLTFTEPAALDVSKFHFEEVAGLSQELTIENLDLQECLIVVKGKIMNSFRWVHPTNRLVFGTGFGNRMGAQSYDANFGTDSFGSCFFGRPGYNFTYATIEVKMMSERHAHQIVNADYIMYSDAGAPTFRHNRQYYHMLLSSDKIEGMKLYGNADGAFFNGTTVEVYAK